MSEDMEKADVEIVRKHLDALGEYFDSVQIFATRYEAEIENGTVAVNMGIGNWYARVGHVKQWILKEDRAETDKE